MIPIPPSHCINDLHSNIEWVMAVTSRMTVAPVVVKPAMVSNHASVRLGSAPLSQKGSRPKTE